MRERTAALAAIRESADNLPTVPDHYRDDEVVALEAIRHTGFAFKWASDRLQEDRAFVIKAVRIRETVLYVVPIHFLDDKEVILAAINCSPWGYLCASERLYNNRDVQMAALRRWPELGDLVPNS